MNVNDNISDALMRIALNQEYYCVGCTDCDPGTCETGRKLAQELAKLNQA